MFAPAPDDLHWENLSNKQRFLLIKKIVYNTLLLIVILLLTTPEQFLAQTQEFVDIFDKEIELPSIVVNFLPSLLLWSFSTFMPILIAWSDRFLGHWTRSEENHNIMKKTFW